jgi:hypothetical protein
MVSVESDPLSASTIVDSAFKQTTLDLTTPPPPTASNRDEEDTCPVCYEPSPPSGDAPTNVACEVCKHAICSECDKMLTQGGHVRCPMCRAPRPIQPLPPLRMAIHAFHCTDAACETPQCADAKLVLLKVQMHVLNQECVAREQRCSGAECKACKLWQGLQAVEVKRAINNSPSPQEIPQEISESLRLRLRELPPEQVKRMLMAHVRQCRNRQCATCRKTRERLALRLTHQRQAVAS